MRRIKLQNWWWVGYPVVVAVFIGVSFKVLIGDDRWVQVVAVRQTTSQSQAKLTALNQRLKVLESVDLGNKLDELKLLTWAVPPTKAVWQMVTGLKAAAAESGVTVTGYKSRVGEVSGELGASQSGVVVEETLALEVTVEAADFGKFAGFLSAWERKLPLVRVVKLSFAGGLAEMTVEGAWKPWTKATEGADQAALFEQLVGEAVAVVSAFDRPVQESLDTATDSGGVVSPF